MTWAENGPDALVTGDTPAPSVGVNGIELWAFVSDHRVRHTMGLHGVFEDFLSFLLP